jgi:hypothetical protein
LGLKYISSSPYKLYAIIKQFPALQSLTVRFTTLDQGSEINLCSNLKLSKFKLNLQSADSFSSVKENLNILTSKAGIQLFELKMTKARANLGDLLVYFSKQRFEEISLQFRTIDADQNLASILFTRKTIERRFSFHSDDKQLNS